MGVREGVEDLESDNVETAVRKACVTGLMSSDKSLGEGRQGRISLTCSSAKNPGQGPSFNFCLLGEGQPDFSCQTKNEDP